MPVGLSRSSTELEKGLEILVIKMSALGDVIQTLPVIPVLKQGFPGSRIHWLVEEAAEPVVRCHPGVDRVLVSRRSAWPRQFRRAETWPAAISQIRALVAELRKPYDLAIDFQGLLKSGIWMGLTKAQRKVGFRWARERLNRLFLNETVGGINGELHAVERYLQLTAWLGCPQVREPEFGLRTPQESKSRMRSFLASQGWDPDSPWAVLVPSARWPSKRWSQEGFARLGDRLAGSLGLQVALVGVGQDRPLVEGIRGKMLKRSINLAGSTDIPALMAILEMAKVVVSTDSGPMHMAAALGTPVVALFGPTAPWRTGPYGSNHRVVRREMSCSPCFRKRCATKSCMESIDPEEVLQQVRLLIEETGHRASREKPAEKVALEAFA